MEYFGFKIHNRKVTYHGTPVGDFANCWYTAREAVDCLWQYKVTESKMRSYLKNGKDLRDLVHDLGHFPEKLANRMKLYGVEPTWSSWHELEHAANCNRLPVHVVEADVESMTDRQVRDFVRKHGPKNLKLYIDLHQALDRADDPETCEYFGNSKEERRQEVNNVWRLTALQMTGMDSGEAFEIFEDMY